MLNQHTINYTYITSISFRDIISKYNSFIPINYTLPISNSMKRHFYFSNGVPYNYLNERVKDFRLNLLHFGKVLHYIHIPKLQPSRLLILILCDVYRSDFRDVVRKYYQANEKKNISYCFILLKGNNSLEIDNESRTNSDIIQIDYPNNYRTITIGVLSAFQYFANYQLSDYVMKTDVDCVVNIDRVLHQINLHSFSKQYSYGGQCYDHIWERLPAHWNVNPKIIWNNGAGYFFPMSYLPLLMASVRHLHEILPMEDINIAKAISQIDYKCFKVLNWTVNYDNQSIDLLRNYYVIHTVGNISLFKEIISIPFSVF